MEADMQTFFIYNSHKRVFGFSLHLPTLNPLILCITYKRWMAMTLQNTFRMYLQEKLVYLCASQRHHIIISPIKRSLIYYAHNYVMFLRCGS